MEKHWLMVYRDYGGVHNNTIRKGGVCIVDEHLVFLSPDRTI
jgi:hypothetical protein